MTTPSPSEPVIPGSSDPNFAAAEFSAPEEAVAHEAGPTLVLGTVVAGVGMMLQTTANVLMVSLQGDLRFGWVTIVDIARQAVAVALIVVLVIAGAGLLPFLAVTIPAGAITLVFTGVLV